MLFPVSTCFSQACRSVFLLIVFSQLAGPAEAQRWGDKHFVYRAENREVADLLQDFAASQSMPVVVDPQVKGRVSANFDVQPADFLRALSKAYALIWYYDGSTLFVYPSSAMQSRLFRLQSSSPDRVRNLMRSLKLGDPRFDLRINPTEKTVLANGPPRHIEIVASVIESLEQGAHDDGLSAVRVIALRHATAADRRSGDNLITGLVTLLTQLYGKQAQSSPVASDVTKNTPLSMQAIDPVAPTALERMYGTKTPGAAARVARSRAGMFVASPPGRLGLTDELSFQADEGSNAVVVQGPATRMAQVEQLIKQLDRPQAMVEIEAAVIDVTTEDLESLGVQWSVTTPNGSSIGVSPTTTAEPSLTSVIPLIGGAVNITTLIRNSGRDFLASIRALEGKGKARIVSRPKVLGSENRFATMVDKRIASVRVAGNLDANLFSIEAGTTLRVMPQIVPGEGPRQLNLTVHIEDGNFEGGVVDQVPIIKRTEINTEALIREGESLLIGGISVQTEINGRSGVPGLSRIPFLGALFRVDDSSVVRRERLFLLTPKVVGSPHSAEPVSSSSARPASAPMVKPMPVAPVASEPVQPPPVAPVGAATVVPIAPYGTGPVEPSAAPVTDRTGNNSAPWTMTPTTEPRGPQAGVPMPMERADKAALRLDSRSETLANATTSTPEVR